MEKIRDFKPDDLNELNHWCELRGLSPLEIEFLSNTGVIVPGVAAGFIYFTNSAVAILDCYLSNPRSNAEERRLALDLIMDTLVDQAIQARCRMIKCTTTIPVMKKRVERFGFKSLGDYTSFIRRI